MNVVIYVNGGPQEGLVLLSRQLEGHELLTERLYALEAIGSDQELDDSSGFIPNCSGDIRVEMMDNEPSIRLDKYGDKYYQGQVCIWSGESFYLRRDE